MNTITIGWEGDDTQFRVEARPEGLWSEGPEITIVREYKGKRDQVGPSIPLDVVPDLLQAILKQYTELVQQAAK